MGDSAGDYDLKVEFLEKNEFIDEEDEFRSFCRNLLEPGLADPYAPASTNLQFGKVGSPSFHNTETFSPKTKPTHAHAAPTSIKRVKPAYMQSLRPETSTVADDDVRLSYARLLFNAFNGLERKELSQKLLALCVEEPTMSVKWIGDKGNPCGPDYREATGLIPVTSWLEAIMVTAVPDAVIKLQDSKLRVRPDKSSYLLCKYTFSGTQVSKIESVGVPVQSGSSSSNPSGTGISMPQTDVTGLQRSHSDTPSGSSSTKSRKRPLELPPVIDYVSQNILEAKTFLQTTYKMNTVGTLIMHINPDKRIHRFEYIQNLIKLTVGKQ